MTLPAPILTMPETPPRQEPAGARDREATVPSCWELASVFALSRLDISRKARISH
jgi:hypothetical protein